MSTNSEEKVVLPHHEQQDLCTTRLPYRQGRKLTAIKAYTINNESNHLLVFNVPSLNLRQETKSLFSKFGKLISFTVTPKHTIESFTETYHAVFENIQSARIAKKMLDTKNFYGGSLHVCYAPEFESLSQTRQKIVQRQRDVTFRLNNLRKEREKKNVIEVMEQKNKTDDIDMVTEDEKLQVTKSITNNVKLNMGEINTIAIGKQNKSVIYNVKGKRKMVRDSFVIEKRFKPCFVNNIERKEVVERDQVNCGNNDSSNTSNMALGNSKETKNNKNNDGLCDNSNDKHIEIIDFTSTEKETISNINDALNYNKFGNEIIRKVENKPLNKIVFNLGNKK